MAKPWLSVIMPCRNGHRWLAAALQSIVDQNEPGLELIFIDGSNDDTSVGIARKFSNAIDLRIYDRPDLMSWMAKTNFGVEQANGDHICMLHTDDLWLPERCRELRGWLSRRPEGAMHLHPCYIIDETGRRLGQWRCPLPAGDKPVPAELLYTRLLVQNFIGVPTPTIRRDGYLRAGGLDDSLWYTADWDLYAKIASFGAVYYSSNPLACFRVHKNSLTVSGSKNAADFRNQHELILNRYIDKVPIGTRTQVFQLSTVSIQVNTALAAAASGDLTQVLKAMAAMLRLGPQGMRRYIAFSRIADRLIPRVRALVFGRL
jgi:glycosyltransferase involved in cell wall biosynthesis